MNDSLLKILIVAAGGALGSAARYVTARQVDARLNSIFPYGTLTVNVVGSFILGLVLTLAARKAGVTESWRLFLGAGFCGGFTTFSTFAWENFNLIEQKFMGTFVLYTSVSLVAGFLALAAGAFLGRFL
ncbi:fluoride efflux transporter CrcB [Chryseolinea lacunae]|uniref:Fluoride-specific ion channel FluC n=1 Tax=Chryseolinea lacunae TaxID=2801331 RepID=A0ABS1KT09_9BACT|nr:fluoride efflux transporter CrcB [Chryseolinea lacunae]MBL0742600.1 fluoride efflux transporter CrcB [Chryseolinea lacunae]